jgi:hypothetical protein
MKSTEELQKLMKFQYLVGSRTRDLPAYNLAPQLLRYRVPECESLTMNDYENKTWKVVLSPINQVTLGKFYESNRHIRWSEGLAQITKYALRWSEAKWSAIMLREVKLNRGKLCASEGYEVVVKWNEWEVMVRCKCNIFSNK